MRELATDPQHLDDPWRFDIIPGIDTDALDWNLAERIKDAVEDLPEDQRTIVECLVWGSMTKVEVAEMMGRTRQSVHDLYKRALATLAKELTDPTSHPVEWADEAA